MDTVQTDIDCPPPVGLTTSQQLAGISFVLIWCDFVFSVLPHNIIPFQEKFS